jgi:flagellar P-ring protein precursor FlgI
VQVNHPTVGRIASGAIIEKEVSFELAGKERLDLVLNENDFTTAARMEEGINGKFGQGCARSVDGRTVSVKVPDPYKERLVELIAELENIEIETDRKARVVLNERTGTVVIGRDVRIAAIAITQGALSIQIGTNFNVSQPEGFSLGKTMVTPEQKVQAEEKSGPLVMLQDGAKVEDLVKALNSLGATPKDLVAIFQAIKAAGALQAELVLI